MIRWNFLGPDYIKANNDGSCRQNRILRGLEAFLGTDTTGSLIFEFSKCIGSMDSLAAELWGIRLNLELGWERGYKHVRIEVDSSRAVVIPEGLRY